MSHSPNRLAPVSSPPDFPPPPPYFRSSTPIWIDTPSTRAAAPATRNTSP
jgi:hypothetical protein